MLTLGPLTEKAQKPVSGKPTYRELTRKGQANEGLSRSLCAFSFPSDSFTLGLH
jgi:hypothetical protein